MKCEEGISAGVRTEATGYFLFDLEFAYSPLGAVVVRWYCRILKEVEDIVPAYVNKSLLIFTKLGRVTLGIYAIHQTIITLLTSWFNIASLRLPYWLYVCCLWVMVSAISYLCYRLIERNRYLSLLFLGK